MIRGPDEAEIKALVAAISHACHGHHMGEVTIALARVVGGLLSTIENPHKRRATLMVFLDVVHDATKDDQDEETLQ